MRAELARGDPLSGTRVKPGLAIHIDLLHKLKGDPFRGVDPLQWTDFTPEPIVLALFSYPGDFSS